MLVQQGQSRIQAARTERRSRHREAYYGALQICSGPGWRYRHRRIAGGSLQRDISGVCTSLTSAQFRARQATLTRSKANWCKVGFTMGGNSQNERRPAVHSARVKALIAEREGHLRHAEASRRSASACLRAASMELSSLGLSLREAARVLGVSHQAVKLAMGHSQPDPPDAPTNAEPVISPKSGGAIRHQGDLDAAAQPRGGVIDDPFDQLWRAIERVG